MLLISCRGREYCRRKHKQGLSTALLGLTWYTNEIITLTHLYKCMENLQDLLLDQNGDEGGIRQELSDELLEPRQEDLHRSQQGVPLLSLLKPDHHRTIAINFLFTLSKNPDLKKYLKICSTSGQTSCK